MQRRVLIAAATASMLPRLVLSQGSLLTIGGLVDRPLALSRADLQALKRREYSERRTLTQDGKNAAQAIRYQGVPLTELLDRAGLKPDRHEIRKAVVIATARDNYQTAFSWGELYNSPVGEGVIVVLRQQEKELLDTDGLPSLRSLQDTRSGPRHVKWLTRVDIVVPG